MAEPTPISILDSIKQSLNLESTDVEFDQDILMLINAAFATLHQLGIGPVEGFAIHDKTTTWDAFLKDDNRLNMVQSYIFKKVKVVFDPPATSYLLTAYLDGIKEDEWRLNSHREVVVYGQTT